MIIKHSYPNLKKELNVFFFLKFLYSIIALVVLSTCIIVNVIIGGYPWSLYVVGGLIIFYYIFFRIDLIDNTILKKLLQIFISICIYLKIIDMINHTSWSWFVDSIILFSLLIIQVLVYFIGIRIHKRKIIPMLGFTVVSEGIFLLAVFKVIKMTWPIIVLGVLATLLLITLFTFFHKTTISEVKKYFNIH